MRRGSPRRSTNIALDIERIVSLGTGDDAAPSVILRGELALTRTSGAASKPRRAPSTAAARNAIAAVISSRSHAPAAPPPFAGHQLGFAGRLRRSDLRPLRRRVLDPETAGRLDAELSALPRSLARAPHDRVGVQRHHRRRRTALVDVALPRPAELDAQAWPARLGARSNRSGRAADNRRPTRAECLRRNRAANPAESARAVPRDPAARGAAPACLRERRNSSHVARRKHRHAS